MGPGGWGRRIEGQRQRNTMGLGSPSHPFSHQCALSERVNATGINVVVDGASSTEDAYRHSTRTNASTLHGTVAAAPYSRVASSEYALLYSHKSSR